MRQQINLYQAVLIDKPEPLRLRQGGLILLLFSVLLALLSLFNFWQMRTAGEQLAVLRQQQDRLSEQVATLERQYPERRKSALLEEEVRRTEGVLEGQKRLLGYFSVREEGGNERILNLLDGLARNLFSRGSGCAGFNWMAAVAKWCWPGAPCVRSRFLSICNFSVKRAF
ncbi:MAG: hypothetical protein GXP51_02620 [Deltaproteobacteria bacterium]|nr:hypothetical protein [Deltaproteobacteria bacterium]